MNIIDVVDGTLSQVKYFLKRLDNEGYTQSLEVFSYSSTGQHTRHIIEFFQCLLSQASTGKINYDHRQRNQLIEKNREVALSAIEDTIEGIKSADLKKILILEHGYDLQNADMVSVQTTFERELVYNIEHAIHHMAMIKIGLRVIAPEMDLPEGFGIAPSTVRHQHIENPARI